MSSKFELAISVTQTYNHRNNMTKLPHFIRMAARAWLCVPLIGWLCRTKPRACGTLTMHGVCNASIECRNEALFILSKLYVARP